MEVEGNWPPTFTLDRERILTLLTGDRFYSDSSAALREAILNAVDAVHRRGQEEPALQPAIRVIFDRTSQTITIRDNGDGMSRETLTDLFSRVGRSAAELAATGDGPVGEFGIGVVSYFMAADDFEVETFDGKHEAVGLRFSKQMFTGIPAEQVEADRTSRGTTLRLRLRDSETYQLLLSKYPHWCRLVSGLEAVEEPEGTRVEQGEPPLDELPAISVELPEGIEDAFLRPVPHVDGWVEMSGASEIAILYRGVFVQTFRADGLWGMEGSILVDPKHFKPRLNREGFVGDEFRTEIRKFLLASHPWVLLELGRLLSAAVDVGSLNDWTERRWATLWLSVPRDDRYRDVAAQWDKVFRRLPAFQLYRKGKLQSASVETLQTITGPIYVAPQKEEQQNDVVKSATRLLRETGKPVLRGISADRRLLRDAKRYFSTTADLIANVLADDLPELRPITPQAEEILESHGVLHVLYEGEDPVHLVKLGEEGPPALKVRRRLLLNVDVDDGKNIIRAALDTNRGRRGLIEATAFVSPKYLSQVASVASVEVPVDEEILGLVKRRYVRSLLT